MNQYGQKKEGAKVDPYVKLTLGSFKKAPTMKSKTQKKQRAAFSLGNEVLSFDIFDPLQYVSVSSDGSGNEEIPLTGTLKICFFFSLRNLYHCATCTSCNYCSTTFFIYSFLFFNAFSVTIAFKQT